MSYRKRIAERNSGKSQSSDWSIYRINTLLGLFVLFLLLIIGRLFHLQVLEHSFYEALASGQHEIYKKLIPVRGQILAQDFHTGETFPVATNQELAQFYAVPNQIEDVDAAVTALAPLVSLDEDMLRERLSKENDTYEPLINGVDDRLKEKIDALNLPGIHSVDESMRFYPLKNLASHITGFLGFKDERRVGQYGLEGFFEEQLAGTPGHVVSEQDTGGNWITIGKRTLEEAKDGDDLVLTIDYTLQFSACSALAEAVEKHGADQGTLIIMNPKTGAILTLCNAPDFDPNTYSKVEDIAQFNNSAVSQAYEPGSVFKPFTMAAAMDLGKVGPNTTYTDTGSVKVASFTIKNSDREAHGLQTMTQVLENSLNTGTIFAVQQMGNDAFYEYVQRFGFGQGTGAEFPAEAPGNISSLATGKDVYAYTGSYGQGLTVTPLQLITAYAAIANKGALMKPYIIAEVVRPNDARIKTEPQVVRQVISQETAVTLAAMLVNVVENGHPKRAGVAGYFLGGKTGTAEVPGADGSYAAGLHKDTFVGFGPVHDPAFVMLAKMDNPRDVQWADSSAAPLFGQVADFLLDYYQVPPDEDEQQVQPK